MARPIPHPEIARWIPNRLPEDRQDKLLKVMGSQGAQGAQFAQELLEDWPHIALIALRMAWAMVRPPVKSQREMRKEARELKAVRGYLAKSSKTLAQVARVCRESQNPQIAADGFLEEFAGWTDRTRVDHERWIARLADLRTTALGELRAPSRRKKGSSIRIEASGYLLEALAVYFKWRGWRVAVERQREDVLLQPALHPSVARSRHTKEKARTVRSGPFVFQPTFVVPRT
jgi:hypothetical protein